MEGKLRDFYLVVQREEEVDDSIWTEFGEAGGNEAFSVGKKR